MRVIIGIVISLVGLLILLNLFMPGCSYFWPTRDSVMIINGGTTQIVSGSVTLHVRKFVLPRMEPGDSVAFEFTNPGDDGYQFFATWADGSVLRDTSGYVTNGMSQSDTFEISPKGARFIGSHSGPP